MTTAPDFTLSDQDGRSHSLSDYRGRWVVLYIYPKDDTPGCTTEACAFRDEHEAIAANSDVVVIGLSADSVASHRRFADKYQLSFTLLSDPSHKTIAEFGSWNGVFAKRNTYVIDPQGRIAKSYESVDPKNHVAQVIKDLPTLMASDS